MRRWRAFVAQGSTLAAEAKGTGELVERVARIYKRLHAFLRNNELERATLCSVHQRLRRGQPRPRVNIDRIGAPLPALQLLYVSILLGRRLLGRPCPSRSRAAAGLPRARLDLRHLHHRGPRARLRPEKKPQVGQVLGAKVEKTRKQRIFYTSSARPSSRVAPAHASAPYIAHRLHILSRAPHLRAREAHAVVYPSRFIEPSLVGAPPDAGEGARCPMQLCSSTRTAARVRHRLRRARGAAPTRRRSPRPTRPRPP